MMTRSLTRIVAVIALTAAAAVANAQVKETVHLVVTGGPNAGTYDASTMKGGCTYGFAGPGSWGNQLSDPKDKDPKHFNSLQLIVPSTKAAATGTGEFYMVIGFGPLMHRGAEYAIESRSGHGKKSGGGTVTVVDHGNIGTVKFNAKTAEGIGLAGTIDCKSVLRAGQ